MHVPFVLGYQSVSVRVFHWGCGTKKLLKRVPLEGCFHLGVYSHTLLDTFVHYWTSNPVGKT